MAKKTRIVGGVTQQSYHTIPDDKDFIITSPNKEAIFEFLSQIGFDKFPEFIRDILVKIEKHTIVDITDGPGDEKQDILTLTPDGHRCLTQCKHSISVSSHYNGDELDRIVSACLRKDSSHAIFVTNTDLTPPAKKYVTDKEYLRGWPDADRPLVIDYWNDARIWEKIKNNSDILNKWFGNLGQTHGLRSFRFELSVQNLPIKEISEVGNYLETVIEQLFYVGKIAKIEETNYQGKLNDETEFYIKKWIQFPTKLNINYLPLDNSGDSPNSPLHALLIEVTVPNNVKYSPSEIKRNIVDFLFKGSLKVLPTDCWWHILASQAKSFIFLHDIGETRQITLNSAETFVKANDLLASEIEYVVLDPNYFDLKSTNEDDDSIFIHKISGIQFIQLFDQLISPYYLYEQQIIQLAHLEKYRAYNFKAVDGVDSHMMMRIRKILMPEWVAIQHGDGSIIWGIPPDADNKNITRVEAKLKVLGLTVLKVQDEDRDKILSNIRSDMPPPTYQITSELNSLSFPINLPSRIFWLSKDLTGHAIINHEKASKLLTFKFYYENRHGFDNMAGKTKLKTHTSELPNMLADIMSIRGTRMLDIGVLNKPYSVNLRFRDCGIEKSTVLALKYIEEFEKVYNIIEKFLVSDLEMDFDAI